MNRINGWIGEIIFEFDKFYWSLCLIVFSIWVFSLKRDSWLKFSLCLFNRIPESDTCSGHSNTSTESGFNTTSIACFRMFSTAAKRFVSSETFTSSSANATRSTTISILQEETILARSRCNFKFRVNIWFQLNFFFSRKLYYSWHI